MVTFFSSFVHDLPVVKRICDSSLLCKLFFLHFSILEIRQRMPSCDQIFCLWHWKNILGADHILAQPLKRRSASRIKPNETFELAKKRQNILCFWGEWEKGISFRCGKVTRKGPKTVKNLLVLQLWVEVGHFDTMRWKYDSVFQHVMNYTGTDFVKESRQEMQRSKEEHFFSQRVLWYERPYFRHSE